MIVCTKAVVSQDDRGHTYRSPRRWRTCHGILILALSLAVTTVWAQGPAGAARPGCGACHQDSRHVLTARRLDKDCTQCHSAAGETHAPSNFVRTVALSPGAQGKEAPAITPARSSNPGMSLPLYYDRTRIGPDPNPMVLVPGGRFIMGTDNRLPDEGPQHSAEVAAYYIDRYEVTNLQYKTFIDATQRRSPSHFRNRTFPRGKADHPVTFVTWHDASTYCEWAGKRLPTDQEWEKAARGSDGRMFPWGDEFDLHKANTPQRWAELQQDGDTTPVGAFEGGVSPYGLYDMSGNVWEWTASWYLPYPGNSRITENYGEKYKTLKGGSWWNCEFYKCGISAPTFNRAFFLRTTKNKGFGFRCAKDAPQGSTAVDGIAPELGDKGQHH